MLNGRAPRTQFPFTFHSRGLLNFHIGVGEREGDFRTKCWGTTQPQQTNYTFLAVRRFERSVLSENSNSWFILHKRRIKVRTVTDLINLAMSFCKF